MISLRTLIDYVIQRVVMSVKDELPDNLQKENSRGINVNRNIKNHRTNVINILLRTIRYTQMFTVEYYKQMSSHFGVTI